MRFNPKAKLSKKILAKNIAMVTTRRGYGEGLVAVAETNAKLVVLCCDLTESTNSHWFAEKWPERFIEVGVAEQNMAGLAAGMALTGFIPWMSSYSVFSPGRNWDQIRVSVCYTNANVKIAGAHAGMNVGPDGATHQALEDIAIMRVLPNITVVVPADAIETKKAVMALSAMKGPAYLRFARSESPVFTTDKSPFTIGQAEILTSGDDVTIVGCGPLLYKALQAADILEKKHKIKAEVINSHTIKPLDGQTIAKSARKTRAIVTVEEHQIYGGLGSAVAEYLSAHYPVPMQFVGMPDSFGESGAPEELLNKYGMSVERIIEAALQTIKMKKF